jgi:hypothetical protein
MKLGLALAGCVLMGCAVMGEYHYRARLVKAVEAHNETLRWGGSSGLEATQDGRRVTNCEVRGIKFSKDRDQATVRLEIEGYLMPQMIVRRWIYEQEWADRDGGWRLVKEKEVRTPKGAVSAAR